MKIKKKPKKPPYAPGKEVIQRISILYQGDKITITQLLTLLPVDVPLNEITTWIENDYDWDGSLSSSSLYIQYAQNIEHTDEYKKRYETYKAKMEKYTAHRENNND